MKAAILAMYLFISLLVIDFLEAYPYEISHKCRETPCIEGDDMSWNINITNRGEQDLHFVSMRIIDSLKGSTVIGYNGTTEISPKKKKSIVINSSVPAANVNKSFVYSVCIAMKVPYETWDKLDDLTDEEAYVQRRLEYCYKYNHSFIVFKCSRDEHCNLNEQCVDNRCQRILCLECQYIYNHKCIDYRCCKDEDCDIEESCKNNTCERIYCNEDEIIENHKCRRIECREDEFVLEKVCTPLNCKEDEAAINHSCVKLTCREDEIIINHSCTALECKEDEAAENHQCKSLQCKEDELAINHECKKLRCLFFQNIVSHQCVNDYVIILSLSGELVSWIIIIFVSTLIIKKYVKLHRK
jgi:hypothetical protein